MDRMTQQEMLQAQINSLERRINQLETWTGANDGGPRDDSASIVEDVTAMRTIFIFLLQHIELLAPGFSLARFREDLHTVNDALEALLIASDPECARRTKTELERWRTIIDQFLPSSEYDQPDRRPIGPFPADLTALLRLRLSARPPSGD